MVTVADDRSSHWIRANHQCRIPKRWVAFDSESRITRTGDDEVQTWAMGAAIRWRADLKTGDHAEAAVFNDALSLWQWVTDFCKPGQRTCVAAHNLGYDVRITQALEILPQLGWRLEWCNLDRNVSAMTWRGEHGTLVLWDSWTWLPMELATVAPTVGLRKLAMPPDNAKHYRWERYCMRDAEIVYRVVSDLVAYIRSHDLGNWQPTGAGMAYTTWRHKFVAHKILVHNDIGALAAERAAMHTGRAEAWRHGELKGTVWTEIDMRNAYMTIASQCDLPARLKYSTGRLNEDQYHALQSRYAVLGYCRVSTQVPVVPYYNSEHTLWPIGTFNTWLWDTEIDMARAEGAKISVSQAYVYTRAPILREWAQWVLSVLRDESEAASPVVRTWLKHCSRALIGRIALRVTQWELYGSNPFGSACITYETDIDSGITRRLMHVGDRTFASSGAEEGRDSLPQVTGWIMAECRVRLWGAMRAAGLPEVAHVDTDAMIVSAAGLRSLLAALGAAWGQAWQVKGSATRVIIHGPRNYRWGHARKAAGVPRKAREVLPNVFTGERWQSVGAALEDGQASAVVVSAGQWVMNAGDPRRVHAAGTSTRPVAVSDQLVASSVTLSSPRSGDGA